MIMYINGKTVTSAVCYMLVVSHLSSFLCKYLCEKLTQVQNLLLDLHLLPAERERMDEACLCVQQNKTTMTGVHFAYYAPNYIDLEE